MAVYRFRKEELEGHLNKNALWAIVYGDMMSYLMILFLVMLTGVLSKQVKPETNIDKALLEVERVFGAPVNPAIAEKAKKVDMEILLGEKLKGMVAGGELGKSASVVMSEKRIVLSLGEGVLFDSGKAELKPEAVTALDGVAKNMVSLGNEIRVEGHTDNVPIHRGAYKSNWELSMARAYAVISQLVQSGVDPKRLSGVGYGEYRPIGDNKTAEGRAKNRRIEISLLREE